MTFKDPPFRPCNNVQYKLDSPLYLCMYIISIAIDNYVILPYSFILKGVLLYMYIPLLHFLGLNLAHRVHG